MTPGRLTNIFNFYLTFLPMYMYISIMLVARVSHSDALLFPSFSPYSPFLVELGVVCNAKYKAASYWTYSDKILAKYLVGF